VLWIQQLQNETSCIILGMARLWILTLNLVQVAALTSTCFLHR
jgi:hypothetical protein